MAVDLVHDAIGRAEAGLAAAVAAVADLRAVIEGGVIGGLEAERDDLQAAVAAADTAVTRAQAEAGRQAEAARSAQMEADRVRAELDAAMARLNAERPAPGPPPVPPTVRTERVGPERVGTVPVLAFPNGLWPDGEILPGQVTRSMLTDDRAPGAVVASGDPFVVSSNGSGLRKLAVRLDPGRSLTLAGSVPRAERVYVEADVRISTGIYPLPPSLHLIGAYSWDETRGPFGRPGADAFGARVVAWNAAATAFGGLGEPRLGLQIFYHASGRPEAVTDDNGRHLWNEPIGDHATEIHSRSYFQSGGWHLDPGHVVESDRWHLIGLSVSIGQDGVGSASVFLDGARVIVASGVPWGAPGATRPVWDLADRPVWDLAGLGLLAEGPAPDGSSPLVEVAGLDVYLPG